ncbi:MAG: glucose dehydrogenase [SAR202 cluster bacterium]|nr:glucose dehydrogenase [SAR202 cluster bacterium]
MPAAVLATVLLLMLAACARLQDAPMPPVNTATPIPPLPASPTSTPALSPELTPTTGAKPTTPAPPTATPVAPATATTIPTPTPTPAPSPTAAPQPPKLALTPVISGLQQPLFLTHAGDGSGDVYVVERRGKIKVVKKGTTRTEPFLDISPLLRTTGSEQGLLGLAFHPGFQGNGYLFVNYTDLRGNTVVARYTAPGNRATADPSSARTILTIDQPFPNHNGGMLAFGPDGMLWIGVGDGGSGGDPRGNGQNLGQLLGKLLRIDVDRGDLYTIPPDNPFAGQANVRGEIWAYGLRNPWRFSFDRLTGDLYIGDVGQNAWEEVDFAAAGSKGGLNFGWNRMEGTHCYSPAANCDRTGLVLPIVEYANNGEGCSVTGGYVYRGKAIPSAAGTYFFTDFCSGTLWAASRDDTGTWRRSVAVAGKGAGHSSLGEDAAGELYVTNLNEGTVYRLAAQ